MSTNEGLIICEGSRKKQRKIRFKSLLIYFIPVIVVIISLFIGRYPVSMGEVITVIINKLMGKEGFSNPIVTSVIFDLRLPRILLGLLVGGSLATSGATLQGMFKNPLVDAGVLGVSSGASFGAVLAIILFNNQPIITMLFAFIFGGLAVFLSYTIGSFYKSTPTMMLVLGGLVISSLFSSLVSFGKYLADPYDELPAIVFWLMGSLANVGYQQIIYIIIPMSIGLVGIFLLRWRINVLSMGDKEALSLGVNVKQVKGLLIVFSTLITASAVCVSGTIGWVGLIIPHIVRMILGNDNIKLIPGSFVLGGAFLVFIDDLARTLTAAELPIGMLTALIGAPFYIILLRKSKGGGW